MWLSYFSVMRVRGRFDLVSQFKFALCASDYFLKQKKKKQAHTKEMLLL